MKCASCGKEVDRQKGAINRSEKKGLRAFCDRACFGVSRRRKVVLTESELKAKKAAYDAMYREKMAEKIKACKLAYYNANKVQIEEKHKVYRKANMPRHVAYCQRPEYKEYKARYDSKLRATKAVGEEYAEAFLLLQDVEKEIESRASRYEIYQQNGLLNKAQKRRRAL